MRPSVPLRNSFVKKWKKRLLKRKLETKLKFKSSGRNVLNNSKTTKKCKKCRELRRVN